MEHPRAPRVPEAGRDRSRPDPARRAAEPDRRRRARISLCDAVTPLPAEAACGWAGAPVSALGGRRQAGTLEAMVAIAGRLRPRNWLARLRRMRVERRARRLVRRVRRGRPDLKAEAPLARLAAFHAPSDGPMSETAAAEELFNLLRPIVAASRFIAHASRFLAHEPGWRERLARDPERPRRSP